MNKRIQFISIILFLAWSGLAFRIGYIQLYCSGELIDKCKSQYLRETNLDSHRGDILDRNGKQLAKDIAYYSFEAYPRYVNDLGNVATAFSKAFQKSRRSYLQRLNKNKNFVYLERKVPALTAEKIDYKKLPGVQRFTHFSRFYPYGEITGQVIGFTDIDNIGIEGIELDFNEYLSGTPGKMVVTADALGRKKTNFEYPIKKPANGHNIVTTIDIDCQVIAVEELGKAVSKYKAISGSVILMNPNTGEILAMASNPIFDSNNYSKSKEANRRNRAITDIFEPGSIYKIVTAAAALELNAIKPEDQIFCENGQVQIGRHTLHDAKPHGIMTFREIIEKSSNIGTYKVAEKIGRKNLYKYSKLFGFGAKSGIEIHGETRGMLKEPSKWSKTSLPSIAIGQEVGVNALQIVNAYAAVANGGLLMRPYIIKAITDESGNIIREFEPKENRRVISPQTAETLSSFFKGVVERGTAIIGTINEHAIAGKTGTAQKIDPETKKYSQKDYISTFVGYFPADNPKIVCLVMLDTPRGAHYGGTVAAPAVKEIFRRISHLPKNTMLASKVTFEKESQKNVSFWEKIQSVWSYFGSPATTGEEQLPDKSNSDILKEKTLSVSERSINLGKKPVGKSNDSGKKKLVAVPDLRGMPIRDAVRKLTGIGLDFEIRGSGTVITQSLPPGTKVAEGRVARITAQNRKPDGTSKQKQ